VKFAQSIMAWYQDNKRMLPWRETKDPYKIWLSEVILQQTRVAQGLPYYIAFTKAFPKVESLAKAKEESVLRLWQGLGYYSRARNLHRCAKTVVNEYDGVFPPSFDELQNLPGIGPYTAAAIASIAFNESVAVVDGNVFRVLARVFGIDLDIASNEGKNFFFAKANELIPGEHPDIFNQAMMEFGATWCTPKNPKCEECIFKKSCVAYNKGVVALLPVKLKKTKVRKRYLNYFILEWNKKIVMTKRETKDIWHGLYDFYLIETTKPQKPERLAEENKLLAQIKKKEIKIYDAVKHILSHQLLSVRFIWVKITDEHLPPDFSLPFFSSKQVASLPKPIVITRFLEEAGFISKV
jgi:A/G-specific adenine glycosylase